MLRSTSVASRPTFKNGSVRSSAFCTAPSLKPTRTLTCSRRPMAAINNVPDPRSPGLLIPSKPISSPAVKPISRLKRKVLRTNKNLIQRAMDTRIRISKPIPAWSVDRFGSLKSTRPIIRAPKAALAWAETRTPTIRRFSSAEKLRLALALKLMPSNR